MMPRLAAARALRRVALGVDGELSRSCALLAELSTLLRTHYTMRLEDELDEDGIVIVPAGYTQRIAAGELRVWWITYQGQLVDEHRVMARAQLETAGVAA